MSLLIILNGSGTAATKSAKRGEKSYPTLKSSERARFKVK